MTSTRNQNRETIETLARLLLAFASNLNSNSSSFFIFSTPSSSSAASRFSIINFYLPLLSMAVASDPGKRASSDRKTSDSTAFVERELPSLSLVIRRRTCSNRLDSIKIQFQFSNSRLGRLLANLLGLECKKHLNQISSGSSESCSRVPHLKLLYVARAKISLFWLELKLVCPWRVE